MFCPKCGSKNADNAKFCSKCGATICIAHKPMPSTKTAPVKSTKPIPPTPRKKNVGPLITIVALLVALIVAMVVIIILLLDGDEPKSEPRQTSSQTVLHTDPSSSTEMPSTEPVETDPPSTSEVATTKPPTETQVPSEDAQTTEPTEVTESVAPTEAVTEAQPENVNMIDGFNSEGRRRINIFLSNFSEAFFGDLDQSNKRDLIFFAYLHNKINSHTYIKADGYYYFISAARVDETLTRFFGKSIEHGSVHDFEYRNNAYYTPAADGESYNSFTVANEMYDMGDGTYLVYFTVYELDLDVYFDSGISNQYYELTPWGAASRSDLTHSYNGSAVVRDYDGGSFQSYQIVNYDVDS